jgi:hypothetical protein
VAIQRSGRIIDPAASGGAELRHSSGNCVGQTWFVSAFLGAAIIIAGVLVMRSHYYTWQRQKADPDIDERERQHLHRRYRRRLQATGLLVLIGILIPVGDIEVLFANRPLLFALHWLAVIALVMWVGLLAVGDLASTRAHSRVSLHRLEQKQRELEREVAALQNRRTNGRSK